MWEVSDELGKYQIHGHEQRRRLKRQDLGFGRKLILVPDRGRIRDRRDYAAAFQCRQMEFRRGLFSRVPPIRNRPDLCLRI
jgi:hypothetical protein